MPRLHIPYFQTTRYRVEAMIELADPRHGQKMADLGSGDGRIIIAFAEKEIEAHGYEIDEDLRKESLGNIKSANIANAFIHDKNFWEENLSGYDIICVYGMPDVMEALQTKLQKELKTGTKILSNFYPFPNWEYTAKKDNTYLYIIK